MIEMHIVDLKVTSGPLEAKGCNPAGLQDFEVVRVEVLQEGSCHREAQAANRSVVQRCPQRDVRILQIVVHPCGVVSAGMGFLDEQDVGGGGQFGKEPGFVACTPQSCTKKPL